MIGIVCACFCDVMGRSSVERLGRFKGETSSRLFHNRPRGNMFNFKCSNASDNATLIRLHAEFNTQLNDHKKQPNELENYPPIEILLEAVKPNEDHHVYIAGC